MTDTNTWNPYKIEQLSRLLSERDERIIADLEKYRLLSTRLIQRLHFPASIGGLHATISSATRTTTRVLGRLEVHGFITRLARRIGGIKHGSAGTIWQLAAAGERYLRARRGDPARRRYIEPSSFFLDHTLNIADLAVRLNEEARAGRTELLTLETEPNCWRDFTNASGGTTTLKPDLYTVTADSEYETHAFIEIDKGTESLTRIVAKSTIYQRYAVTGIEQQEHGIFPAVIWVTEDPLRADRIAKAIATEPGLDPDLFFITTNERALELLAPETSPLQSGGENQ